MFIVGITGGIGCGKSTAARICREAGLPVIDADEISRQVTAAGGSALPAITEAFGKGVIDAKGALDRQAMAKKVFQNHRTLDQLSQIIHRQVVEIMGRQIEKLKEKKARAAVLDVPIPVKQGFLDVCDQVWVIWADDETRISRLEARGMAREEALRRMSMQMNRDEYARIADHMVDNNGSEHELEGNIHLLLQTELGQRGIRITPPKADPSGQPSDIEPEKDDIAIG
jgi:dephospho-CoA kinase